MQIEISSCFILYIGIPTCFLSALICLYNFTGAAY